MEEYDDITINYKSLITKLKNHRKKLESEKPYGWEWETNGINAAILIAGLCRVEEKHAQDVLDGTEPPEEAHNGE